MKRIPLLVMSLVAAVLLSACADGGDAAAATVNGNDIPTSAIDAELQAFRDSERYEEFGGSDDIDSIERQFAQGILAQLVRRAVIEPIARDLGVEVTEAQIDAEMDVIRADFPDDATFQDALAAQALTEEKLRELVADRMLEEGVRQEVIGELAASPEEVKAFYDENIEDYQETCAQHILVADEQTARLVESELRNAPESEIDAEWARIAEARSVDSSNANDSGNLGCNPPGQFVPEFEEAMNGLDIGEISEPVQTEFGFHVIRVTERTTIPFLEVEEQIFEQLTGPEQDQAWNDFLVEAYEEAGAEINPRYGILDPTTGQITNPTAEDVPGAEEPKSDEQEEPVDAPAPGGGGAPPPG
jgi:parvulin-like peptidyl-prolyl isomerase